MFSLSGRDAPRVPLTDHSGQIVGERACGVWVFRIVDSAGRDPVLKLRWAYVCLAHDSFVGYIEYYVILIIWYQLKSIMKSGLDIVDYLFV
jgi:hypothetical protein